MHWLFSSLWSAGKPDSNDDVVSLHVKEVLGTQPGYFAEFRTGHVETVWTWCMKDGVRCNMYFLFVTTEYYPTLPLPKEQCTSQDHTTHLASWIDTQLICWLLNMSTCNIQNCLLRVTVGKLSSTLKTIIDRKQQWKSAPLTHYCGNTALQAWVLK